MSDHDLGSLRPELNCCRAFLFLRTFVACHAKRQRSASQFDWLWYQHRPIVLAPRAAFVKFDGASRDAKHLGSLNHRIAHVLAPRLELVVCHGKLLPTGGVAISYPWEPGFRPTPLLLAKD
ncbi:hypothetical protein [Caudoviricetes sp.]|nr:hypothetical protein [Caudoviricetes sp.]UOF81541.1 hypothetical protein [Caudoviricetes sp.]